MKADFEWGIDIASSPFFYGTLYWWSMVSKITKMQRLVNHVWFPLSLRPSHSHQDSQEMEPYWDRTIYIVYCVAKKIPISSKWWNWGKFNLGFYLKKEGKWLFMIKYFCFCWTILKTEQTRYLLYIKIQNLLQRNMTLFVSFWQLIIYNESKLKTHMGGKINNRNPFIG